MKSTEIKINEDIEFIKKRIEKYGGVERLGQIFEVAGEGYFYDSGTGKILSCNTDEFMFFEWLFSNDEETKQTDLIFSPRLSAAINSVKAAVEQHNLLQAPIIIEFDSPTHKDGFDESLKDGISLITLELTERCNLRCGYCIYNESYDGERNFSMTDMSIEVLEASLVFFTEHSSEDVAVTFYGGEPLLRFDLIKHAVEYSQRLLGERKLSFSMTTNLTLMTAEMAEFFAAIDGFSIVCSIDGPEQMHDQYRKYPDGSGSFAGVMRGLKLLVEAHRRNGKTDEEMKSVLSFSMVFGLPHTQERVALIQEFISSIKWLPSGVEKRITYPTSGTFEVDPSFLETVADKKNVHDPILDWATSSLLEKSDVPLFTATHLDSALLRIHNRPVFDVPVQATGMNGCCLPGTRRLYICVNGDLKPCERMGKCPSIGNVFSGFDIEKIKNLYVREYEEKSLRDCNDCWAFKICGVCYANLYTENSLDMEKKKLRCEEARRVCLRLLEDYHKILAFDSESLAHLNDIMIT